MTIKDPEFKVGETVYHIMPDSKKGVVLEISYNMTYDFYRYLVALGFGEESWCAENELSLEKTF